MFLLGDLISAGLLIPLGVASAFWMLLHLLIRFHPRGIEISGGILFLLGFVMWLLQARPLPPYGPGLLMIGLMVHATGRFLRRLKASRSGR